MLSAYVDRELTQADSQRVRIHLDECPECRQALQQLRGLQRLTAEMKFTDPPEDKMEELERRLSVQAPRRAGWGLFLSGISVWLVYAVYLFVTSPVQLFEKLAVGAVVIGLVLLFVSVLRERLLVLPHDRYRGVKR